MILQANATNVFAESVRVSAHAECGNCVLCASSCSGLADSRRGQLSTQHRTANFLTLQTNATNVFAEAVQMRMQRLGPAHYAQVVVSV